MYRTVRFPVFLASTWICGQVNLLHDAYPMYRNMTGEPFERDHWHKLFGLIRSKDDEKCLQWKDFSRKCSPGR
eukprot:5125564-Amphidinium_carterae.1